MHNDAQQPSVASIDHDQAATVTSEPVAARPKPRAELTKFAMSPVVSISVVVGLILAVASASYQYFGDELYFLSSGDRLAWGYADQPPLLPLLARVMDTLLPHSPFGLRLPSILATMAGVVVAALTARELGGTARGQVLAAAAFAICPQFLVNGRLLATQTLDPILWTVITWLLVRWVRLHARDQADDRLLLWAGLFTAVALQAKMLIIGFWASVVLAVLLCGPRRMLTRPLLWVGGALAVASTIPTLLWQAAHGWPQLGMQDVILAESRFTGGLLIPGGLFVPGLLGGAMCCFGVYRLLRSPRLRPYRFFGVALLLLTALFVWVGARDYYVAGMYPLTWAVAAVNLQWLPRIDRIAWAACTLSGVVALSSLTPFPAPTLPGALYNNTSNSDWEQLADHVRGALDSMPPETRAATAVITSDYWSASAIDQFRPEVPVYSGSRGFGYFGPPPENVRTVLFVGDPPRRVRQSFSSVEVRSTLDTDNDVHDGRQLWLAKGPKYSWSQMWPRFQTMLMYM